MKQSTELRLLIAKQSVLKNNLYRAILSKKDTEIIYGFERELKLCITSIRKLKTN